MQQPPEQDQGSMSPEPGYIPQAGGSAMPDSGTARETEPAHAPMQPPQEAATGAAQAPGAGPVPIPNQWVTFSTIKGLPIVDLTTGARVGDVGDLILSPTFRYVEAYTSVSGAFHRDKTFPARGSVIGRHAVTLPRGALETWDVQGLEQMPRASLLIGMKLLTETGRIVGQIREIRLDPNSCAVLSFDIHALERSILDRLRRRKTHSFPADAVTQYGRDAVIVQDALARQYLGEQA